MIKGLHHNAYRCRDTAETRAFYEDFLGLPLAGALEINETKTGRQTRVLHTFFRMGDGSFLAFFDVPDTPFEFKPQHDFDLHIALAVEPRELEAMLDKGKAEGREVRGPIDHGFIRSIYFRDPNGYVIELTTPTGRQGELVDPARSRAHEILARWEEAKASRRV
jgi:catechol 2,3-dioxygenase-like lactoylglutathione lyase family enzyme